ncbi:MAG: succinyl-diaminopimelate desuccinylase [Pseudomonadota bacterium]|nr:succinyl-diaminopimelate desuccinylase [Pseudomonadota bacterium]
MINTLELAKSLIKERSISPNDCNCQEIIKRILIELGFEVKDLPFGPVKNLWATRTGTEEGRTFCFAGHTDVVPAGALESWKFDPFEGTVHDNMLHGRGAADMKGSLAAMVTATERFLESVKEYPGTIAFLLTSDEEDQAIDGTAKAIKTIMADGTKIDFCLIGEPSSSEKLGDTIRVGRRGSLSGKLLVRGIQGHVAYPDLARNPIHECSSILTALCTEKWDSGNEFFPATSFQVSNISAGTGANNVIPGQAMIDFNFRFSPELTEKEIKERTEDIINRNCEEFDLDWKLSGNPFITRGGTLIPVVQQAIKDFMGFDTKLSTSGGTSDGRFIRPMGIEVVELGPTNRTIHKVNEAVHIKELEDLSNIYESILMKIFKS